MTGVVYMGILGNLRKEIDKPIEYLDVARSIVVFDIKSDLSTQEDSNEV
jgi:hypothetical protein